MLCPWRGVLNGPQDMEERKDLHEGKKASSLDLSEWKEERSQVSFRKEVKRCLTACTWADRLLLRQPIF